jgi:phosphoribosyl 1,2-cyclic phosphodiesterase
MRIHFLGVRGSTPCADDAYTIYGGHTSCVAVECDNQIFFFDAGSGIINGSQLALNCTEQKCYLFFSHVHLDHIMGLPFFGPIWKKGFQLQIAAGTLLPYGGIQNFLRRTFQEPLFPISFENFPATITCIDFDPDITVFTFGAVTLKTIRINHPNGAVGYRIECNGKSMCYITDHEHEHEHDEYREKLTQFVYGTDVLIYDSSYGDEYFDDFKGRGHSTWQEAIRLGENAQVKRIGIFHHDPKNTDDSMAILEKEALALSPKILVTRQGMCISLD